MSPPPPPPPPETGLAKPTKKKHNPLYTHRRSEKAALLATEQRWISLGDRIALKLFQKMGEILKIPFFDLYDQHIPRSPGVQETPPPPLYRRFYSAADAVERSVVVCDRAGVPVVGYLQGLVWPCNFHVVEALRVLVGGYGGQLDDPPLPVEGGSWSFHICSGCMRLGGGGEAKNPFPSCTDGTRIHNLDANLEFNRALDRTTCAVNSAFKLLDPNAYAIYQKSTIINNTPELHDRSVFLSKTIHINKPIDWHRNIRTPNSGWSCIVVFGDSEKKAGFVVPELGIKFVVSFGDVVFIRAFALAWFLEAAAAGGAVGLCFVVYFTDREAFGVNLWDGYVAEGRDVGGSEIVGTVETAEMVEVGKGKRKKPEGTNEGEPQEAESVKRQRGV